MRNIVAFMLLFIGLTLPVFSQASVYGLPKLGDSIPCIPIDSVRWLISSAQTATGCDIELSGMRFFIAAIDGKSVSFISTRDSSFVSPEGIKVGNKIKDVRSVGGSEIISEIGWGSYSKLPSGWCVSYIGQLAYQMHHDFTTISKDSLIYELFLRK